MKLIITFLFFYVSLSVCAQKKDSVITNGPLRNDTYVRLNCGCKSKKPVFVLDGVVNDSLKNVNPNDIFKLYVLKNSVDTLIYGKNAQNGVVLIITKNYALKQLQTKLSAFSKPFKKFIAQDYSGQITYIFNGSIITEINAYDLPKEKIKKVKFLTSEINPVVNIKGDEFIFPEVKPAQIHIKGDR